MSSLGEPLIITATPQERDVLRRAFGASQVRIQFVGQHLTGYRASCIITTPDVDITSDWFRTHVMTRLMPGGRVFELVL